MATKKNETAEVKRGELVNAAKELNELLELDPAINVKAKPEELTEKLLEAATLLDVEDEITKETAATLTAIGATLPGKTKKEMASKPKAAAEKPAGKAKKPAAPTREDLIELAEELNTIDGMVPIDLELEDDGLIAAIKGAAGTLSTADVLTDAGWASLAGLGVKKPVAEKPAKADKKAAAKPAGKGKADKPKKEAAEPKAKEVTALGSRLGSQAADIDAVIVAAKKPMTLKELAEKSSFSVARIKIHVNHLIKKKGLDLDRGDDKFGIK